MSDWDKFIDSVPWFLDTDAEVSVSRPHDGVRLPPAEARTYPVLATLLAQSRVTPVSINNDSHQLLTWNAIDGYRIGWLCRQPGRDMPEDIHPEHATLSQSFGGIIERFNEPEGTWLLNHNEVLTGREASFDASFINEYMWAFTDAGAELPIQPSEYYSIAREANGNTTLCHRVSGQVILFAPDHSFDFVIPLSGCPEYTLYTLNGVRNLRDWVNTVAGQWLAHVAKSL